VKLDETGADGFIPAAMLGDDYFRHDPARHALIGSRTGQIHRLCDIVTVRLVEAAPLAGALRFELVSETASRQARPRAAKAKRSPRHRPDFESPHLRRGDSGAANR
ncbi:MAG: ribonuclease R, partial [Methylocella sp.]